MLNFINKINLTASLVFGSSDILIHEIYSVTYFNLKLFLLFFLTIVNFMSNVIVLQTTP